MFYYDPQLHVGAVSSMYECYRKCVEQDGCNEWTFPTTIEAEGADCVLSKSVSYKKSDASYTSGTLDCKWSKLVITKVQVLLISLALVYLSYSITLPNVVVSRSPSPF